MPQQHGPSHQEITPATTTSYGQVIEYIQDRLFLASYTHPPNAHTPFPYPTQPSKSPTKRSARAQQGPAPTPRPTRVLPPVYFSIDTALLYNAFHADFGPLHIGHLYRFAVTLHDVLGDPENQGRYVVFWSNADSRSRANAACLLACYMVLIQAWPPHLALAPIAQMDPPCMPFRDAGYSQADYGLTIQDVVYGVWKAREEALVGLKTFDLEEYETFERVDMGDFNWITPNFVAFASPQHQPTTVIAPTDPLYATLPRTLDDVYRSKLPQPFKNVLAHFTERNIGLVVRLNSELYSPSYFTALRIKHLDMIFDDGTCPPLKLVRKFINLAHEMITVKNKGIAVHCKAGLGRTGCLIGAYLIYKHGFTANEIIAYMRFMRPGMVVGPQQHWLHLNQGTFREWWFEDCMKEKMAAILPSTPSRSTAANRQRLASNGQTFTPPNGSQKRAALGEIKMNEQQPASEARLSTLGVHDENLPAPTPGQPRKTSKIYGGGSMRRPHVGGENEPFDIHPDTEIVSMQQTTMAESESEGEMALRVLGSRKASISPASRRHDGKRRAVSCTTTTTTTTKWNDPDGSDIENRMVRPDDAEGEVAAATAKERRPKTPGSTKSGSGLGGISVGKSRSPSRRSTDGKNGVRKTSGRVGSVGANAVKSKA
ncbi:cell division control protein 14 [Elasticomyces elasticus]|nr:cell division control protein 14 [Elasticomyces elasticus]